MIMKNRYWVCFSQKDHRGTRLKHSVRNIIQAEDLFTGQEKRYLIKYSATLRVSILGKEFDMSLGVTVGSILLALLVIGIILSDEEDKK